ncbi:FAD-dependent monooxygenase [Acrocarpospora catenulata]|uniref:FAD-dependent monooxygenase n=1 Tax=Acrocarpospora catenulata TaxID=2836182 RepID=UPI001BDA939E|nr:FAD-dependent monooxygenase [Acrocarpospora catenulata]
MTVAGDPIQIVVVGGGIGGLAAANALLHRGMDVHVYEQAPELGEIGAGVLITPNSLRLLDRFGIGDAIAAVGATVGEGSRYYREDGATVAPILTVDSSGWNGMFGVHRADLVGVLADALPADRVHTGHRAVSFAQDERTAVVGFDNGAEVRADAVIAADGIHSVLQRYVVEPSAPVDSGSVAYRGLVPAERVPWWPKGVSQLWMGEQRHFLVYPVRRGTLINYVGFVPSHQQTVESWTAEGDVQTLRAEFATWDSPVPRLLAEVEKTHWWGLYDRDPLATWTRGRLTLLGDAAHPMLPHLGQGANQSIEDAVALSVFLADATAEDVPEALRHYEDLRRGRTTEVQLGARANGRRYDSHFQDLAERDAEIAGSVRFRSWLYDYDAEAAALEALAVR